MTPSDSSDSPRDAAREMKGREPATTSRVGLLLESLIQPAWAGTTIRRLLTDPGVSIALVVLATNMQPLSKGREWQLGRITDHGLVTAFERLDERLLGTLPNPFAREDLRQLLNSLTMVTTRMRHSQAGWQLPAEDAEAISSAHLDALLYFGEETSFNGDIVSAARHGLWVFGHASPPPYKGAPSGFWETLACEMTADVGLFALTNDGVEELCSSVIAARHVSPARTRSAIYWTSTSFPERALARLRHGEGRQPEGGLKAAAGRPAKERDPRDGRAEKPNRRLARCLPRYLSRAGRETVRAVLGHNQWFLALSWADDGVVPSLKTPIRLVPPRDRFWADPHAIEREGRYYVFVEEVIFSKKRGRIAVLVLDRSGMISGPVTVLERPYHLSYPFLFEHADALYMIPETSAHDTIELYRCVKFPTEWEFVRNLMQGVKALDSTILFHEDRWWLFTSITGAEGPDLNSELHLFSSEDPLTGEWTPHPRNPIVSDARTARPAGPIFRRQGRLVRPSQQTVPEYGYAIWLNEILTLTSSEYLETSLACLRPEWEEGLIGTHTISRAGDLTVVDGCRWRPRFASAS